MKPLFAALFFLGTLAHAQTVVNPFVNEKLHSWETAIEFNSDGNVLGDYQFSSFITLDVGAIQCVDRIELSLEATRGAPTLFVISGEPRHSDPKSQDLHAGTITLPRAIDPHYPTIVRRLTSQVFVLVGGDAGSWARVNYARAIVVPNSMCRTAP